jgi:hypothetical protein
MESKNSRMMLIQWHDVRTYRCRSLSCLGRKEDTCAPMRCDTELQSTSVSERVYRVVYRPTYAASETAAPMDLPHRVKLVPRLSN